MNKVNWGNVAKTSVGCAGAFGILFLLLCCVIYYSPDKNELTKHAHTEWSRQFREVGLAEVPLHAKYWGGAGTDGVYGHWNFRADIPKVRQWLSSSQSLRTAKVKTKPGKKAYLFYTPAAHRVCRVMVFFGPIMMNPPLSECEALVQVTTIKVGVRMICPDGRTRVMESAEDTLKDQAHERDINSLWAKDQ